MIEVYTEETQFKNKIKERKRRTNVPSSGLKKRTFNLTFLYLRCHHPNDISPKYIYKQMTVSIKYSTFKLNQLSY